MAAKAIALMLVIALMVSTFTVRANAFDVAASGRSLIRLNFLSHVDHSRLLAATPASSDEAPTPSADNAGGQSWGGWFKQKMGSVTGMMGGSSDSGAPAPAPAA